MMPEQYPNETAYGPTYDRLDGSTVRRDAVEGACIKHTCGDTKTTHTAKLRGDGVEQGGRGLAVCGFSKKNDSDILAYSTSVILLNLCNLS